MKSKVIKRKNDRERNIGTRSGSLTGWRSAIPSTSPMKLAHGGEPMGTWLRQSQRFAIAAGLALAVGFANIPKAGAQILHPFTTPAVHTHAADNQDFEGNYSILSPVPLVPIHALSVGSNGGGVAIAQATANKNSKRTFMAMAQAVSPSPNDIAPTYLLESQAAMDVRISDPLGRDRVKVEVEIGAVATAGSPLRNANPSYLPHDAVSIFHVEVGEYWGDGQVRQDPDGRKLIKWVEVRRPPLLTVHGAHFRSLLDGGVDNNSLVILGNGQEIERRIGSGSLLYGEKIVLNVPVGIPLLMTIEATASLNGFTYVDPVVTPHPDNPEVVVTLRGALDPNPPPLAILSPEELTAAGIDITPVQELGLFDPPAPANQPPVARCQPVTLPATQNSCAITTASIDNGSSDPDGDTLTLTQSPAGPYPVGNTNVTLTVSDGALSSQCTATVTVTDAQAPAITCPADQTVTATSGSSAIVNFSPTASDNCSTLITSCTPASGATFPLGTTAVTCTATDGAGLQNSCGFNVQVAPVPVTTVPFTNGRAKVEVERGPAALDDELEFKMAFTLGAGNNGIAPRTEVVRTQVGPLTFIIPASSFRVDSRGRYKFAGTLNGARVQASLSPLQGGRYEFKLEATPLNLTTFPNPVATQLVIGNDSGSAIVPVAFE